MGQAIATIERAAIVPPLVSPDFGQGLTTFAAVPPRHGVASIAGLVAVYDQEQWRRDGLEPGGFYVVEYQRPRACMPWAMFHSLQGCRLETEREVVLVERHPRMADHWQFRCANRFWNAVEGPLTEINLCDMIVGRVVGIYSPNRSA